MAKEIAQDPLAVAQSWWTARHVGRLVGESNENDLKERSLAETTETILNLNRDLARFALDSSEEGSPFFTARGVDLYRAAMKAAPVLRELHEVAMQIRSEAMARIELGKRIDPAYPFPNDAKNPGLKTGLILEILRHRPTIEPLELLSIVSELSPIYFDADDATPEQRLSRVRMDLKSARKAAKVAATATVN